MAGYPRVTHPSATKLTKSLPKIWQRLTPFDLHVLSTPPAFILSQDQTLILNSSTTIYLRLSCQFYLAYFWFVSSDFSFGLLFWIFSWDSFWCIPLEFSGLHYCLFVKVLTITFVFVSLLFCVSQATLISYHVVSCLSTTFLFFSKSFCLPILKLSNRFARWIFIIARRDIFVNNFFSILFQHLLR